MVPYHADRVGLKSFGFEDPKDPEATEERCIQRCFEYRYCVGIFYSSAGSEISCSLYSTILSFTTLEKDNRYVARRTTMVTCGK